MPKSPTWTEFESLRPRLMLLLELHRSARTEADRATLADLFEDVFLSTAWHVAQDLLEHGWRPGFAPNDAKTTHGHLRVVAGTDAA